MEASPSDLTLALKIPKISATEALNRGLAVPRLMFKCLGSDSVTLPSLEEEELTMKSDHMTSLVCLAFPALR